MYRIRTYVRNSSACPAPTEGEKFMGLPHSTKPERPPLKPRQEFQIWSDTWMWTVSPGLRQGIATLEGDPPPPSLFLLRQK